MLLISWLPDFFLQAGYTTELPAPFIKGTGNFVYFDHLRLWIFKDQQPGNPIV